MGNETYQTIIQLLKVPVLRLLGVRRSPVLGLRLQALMFKHVREAKEAWHPTRVTTMRQESRPSKYAGVIVDHHKPDTGELWLARAQGFMIALALLGVIWFLSEGVITK